MFVCLCVIQRVTEAQVDNILVSVKNLYFCLRQSLSQLILVLKLLLVHNKRDHNIRVRFLFATVSFSKSVALLFLFKKRDSLSLTLGRSFRSS